MTIAEPCRSLYVHVPFCHTICGYCDFYSEVFDRNAAPKLVDALLAELATVEARLRGNIDTIFVGGGTPTTLAVDDLARLLKRLNALRDPTREIELTVEANPATVAPETAETLARCGVTRVSIGAQSFDRSELRVLDRIHRPEQVAETIENCRRAGLNALSVDLIFAVPGQTVEAWTRNLDAAIALGTSHMSCYGLTYERGTPLFDALGAGRITRVDEEIEADMLDVTIDRLAAAGLARYEISNYAKPGFECRHNLRYWHNEPYAGIGPSAAGYMDGVRYKNIPDTAEYVRALAAGKSVRIESERLAIDATARETATLELRLVEGIDRAQFRERFARDPVELFADAVAKNVELGFMTRDDRSIRLTRRGLMVADAILVEFV